MEAKTGVPVGNFCTPLSVPFRRFGGCSGTLIWVLEGVTVSVFRFFAENLIFGPQGWVRAPRRGPKPAKKTAFSGRFRLFSAPKTEGRLRERAPRHFWRPPPMRGCGIAYLEHFEHRWGGQARRIRRLCHFLAFAAQLFWPRGRFRPIWDPRKWAKMAVFLSKNGDFQKVRFFRLRRFSQRCPPGPPACAS